MFVAYYRVSTVKQGTSGLGLDAQRAAVLAHCTPIAEFTEVESGSKNHRPQLAAALAHAKATGATLLIAKLDRLARNVAFIANLLESGVPITAVDMPEANRFMLHVMAAVAEHERQAISDRTRAALQQAKQRGVALGGCRGDARTRADAHAASVIPHVAAMLASGPIRASVIAQRLNALGILTARGGAWQCVQVQRLLARLT